MQKSPLVLLIFILSVHGSFMKKYSMLSPIDYLQSLINYCTGKPELDFCSKEQIEFGLEFLWEYQKKIQREIEIQKQELIQRKKQNKLLIRRKQAEELKQRQMKQKLREHFLDRHI